MAKILIVEDDESLLSAYGLALDHAGYEVMLAKSGQEALDLTKTSSPDVILLDLLLPNMTGVDFLEAYQPKQHPEVHIIVFSNMAAPGTIERTKQLGASEYLIKANYTPKEITQLITAYLASRADKNHEIQPPA